MATVIPPAISTKNTRQSPSATHLADSYGRRFHYLRLSVTDACNFSCQYCLPNGYRKTGTEDFLSLEEIRNAASAFAKAGMKKIRLTGGEPTLRRDIVDIIRTIRNIPEVETIALTTNGTRLAELAPQFRLAGLDAINISIDSLDEKTFNQVTGTSRFNEVLRGIESCLTLGFSSIKLNAVLLRDMNDAHLETFMDWIRTRPVSIRFIELMQTADNRPFFERRHISSTVLETKLIAAGWSKQARAIDAGPAQEYSHPNYAGRIGLIAPYSPKFCDSCNRLRISARGELKLCLFGNGSHSIRNLMQSPDQSLDLIRIVSNLLGIKPESHYLHSGDFGSTENLSTIGG